MEVQIGCKPKEGTRVPAVLAMQSSQLTFGKLINYSNNKEEPKKEEKKEEAKLEERRNPYGVKTSTKISTKTWARGVAKKIKTCTKTSTKTWAPGVAKKKENRP